jgi:hypothetical protein
MIVVRRLNVEVRVLTLTLLFLQVAQAVVTCFRRFSAIDDDISR